MKTALLVIDVQQSFVHRPYFSQEGMPSYLQAQNRLIAIAKARQWSIVRILHTSQTDDVTDPFGLSSGQVRPLDGLSEFDAALTVHKTRHSALVGTGLECWLTENGIGHLVVSGIRTEQCCETTARHASDMGWKVSFVPEATMTWDMRSLSGERLSAQDIRERTAAVLHGRFAQVLCLDILAEDAALA